MKRASRELRLAYLAAILLKQFGKNQQHSTYKRYCQVTKALRIERLSEDVGGFMINGKIVVREFKRQANEG